MEAAMRGLFDRSGESADEGIYRSWRIGILALPVLVVTVMAAMLIAHPNLFSRIANAARAELARPAPATKVGPAAVQPARDVRSTKSN
jgi:hypothetical protein